MANYDRVIEDEVDTIFQKYDRIDVSNVLVLTGGGTLQTFFALGSCGCLHDNGMLQHDSFDVISVVSGGSLLAAFIEMCYFYEYDLEDDWYNKYVRQGGVYAWSNNNSFGRLVAHLGNLTKFGEFIFDKLPAYNRELGDTPRRGPTFEYNYLDTKTNSMTTDHSDVVDFDKGTRYPNWYFIRALRCGLPITIFNGKGSIDAGAISNIPSTTIFRKYDVTKQLIVIKCSSELKYYDYPTPTFANIIKNIREHISFSARNSITDPIDILTNANENIMVSASNNLNRSKDKFHKELFQDKRIWESANAFLGMYNGLIDIDLDYAKVVENEGYLQMYHTLKDRGKLKPDFEFRIPNPEVYNDRVSEHVARASKITLTDIIAKMTSSIFDACVDVYL